MIDWRKHLFFITFIIIAIAVTAGLVYRIFSSVPEVNISKVNLSIDTSNWVLYTNTNYNFTMMIPPSLTIKEEPDPVRDLIIFTRPQSDPNFQTIEDDILQLNISEDLGLKYEPRYKTINGYDYTISRTCCLATYNHYYETFVNGNYYDFHAFSYNLLEQVLQTFKVNSSANDWRVYNDPNFKYQFKYPPDWKVIAVPGGLEISNQTDRGEIFPEAFRGTINESLIAIEKYADILSKSPLEFNGHKWTFVKFRDRINRSDMNSAYFEESGIVYKFTTGTSAQENNTLIKILETFKLIQ